MRDPSMFPISDPDWVADSTKWRGSPLTGDWSHWCHAWDGLPVDETTPELNCCECTFPGSMGERPSGADFPEPENHAS